MRHDSHFVEQLVRADELPVGRRIPIHLIEANPDQPRSAMGDLTDLTRSIVDKGVLEPILVRPRGDGRFTIISGERRFRASLDAGLSEIPCIEMDVADNELLEIALVENLQRKDLSPFEEADGYRALQERHGYTHEQIADAVGKSRVTITEALSIGRLPELVQAECRRADIGSRSFLLELGRLKDEDLMLAAVMAMASGDTLSRDVLREVKKDARRGASSKLGGMKRAYTLDFAPEDKRYKVSLVLKGRIHKKDEILEAIRDLARRIGAGDIDLETQGRFVKARAAKAKK
ncbi:MAG TPA: ParB/RepB/Spo0J family partition protein [Thermoanaerobaculia bacterium]|nr:ParB/RepB/Spo0J family partition protein [Thermoanaerobaculia bacterium]